MQLDPGERQLSDKVQRDLKNSKFYVSLVSMKRDLENSADFRVVLLGCETSLIRLNTMVQVNPRFLSYK